LVSRPEVEIAKEAPVRSPVKESVRMAAKDVYRGVEGFLGVTAKRKGRKAFKAG